MPKGSILTSGHIDLTLFLLENDASLILSDLNKNNTIHYCAKNGHAMLLKLLLEKRPDVNSKNIEGKTPLDLAGSLKVKQTLDNYSQQSTPKFNKIKIHDLKKEEASPMKSNFGPKYLEKKDKSKPNLGVKSKLVATKTKGEPASTAKGGAKEKKEALGMKVQKSHKQFNMVKNNLTAAKFKQTIESAPLQKTGTQTKIKTMPKKRPVTETKGVKKVEPVLKLDDDSNMQSIFLNS